MLSLILKYFKIYHLHNIRCLAFLIFIIAENIVLEHNIWFIDSKSTVMKGKKKTMKLGKSKLL